MRRAVIFKSDRLEGGKSLRWPGRDWGADDGKVRRKGGSKRLILRD